MKRTRILLGLGMFLILAATALGAVPQLINFQGVLKDGSGNPVTDGSYSVTFTVYNAPAGGTVYWAETTSVTTTNGLFSVLLGSLNPVPESLFYDPSRYLGIKVGTDPEMTPRQQLSSVGYSSVSSQWTSAGENLFRLNGNVGIGTFAPPGAKLSVVNVASGAAEQRAVSGAASNSSTGNVIGGEFVANSSGTGLQFGVRAIAVSASSNPAYGVFGQAAIGVLGNAYGGYFTASSSGGSSTQYGVYSQVVSANGWGFFTPNNAYLGGNVGIGTTSPTAPLHVSSPSPNNSNPSLILDDGGFGNEPQVWVRSGTIRGRMSVNGSNETMFAGTLTNNPFELQTNSTARVHITAGGNVGIGTTAPAHPLHMASGAHVTVGGTWTNASSRSYKTDIQPLKDKEYDEILEKLENLDVVRFQYKKDPGREHIGLIAEDVPEEIASEDRTGVPTGDAIAFLMAAVKAQQSRIQDLEETIRQLKTDR